MRTSRVGAGRTVWGGVVFAAGTLVLAGAGCSSQPPAPPEQTAAQSSAVTEPTCPKIEVEPSGRATQRFVLGDATLKVTVDPRDGRASSRIELAHRMFSESESNLDDFDRDGDGLAIGLRFGEAYFGDEHNIGLLQDDGVTFALVDGRPITPITSDSQPATFLDGSPVPTWNASETAAAQVRGIVDLEGRCASPDLIVHAGPFKLVCELPILICSVDFLVCLGEAHTLLAFRMCGKAAFNCFAGIPEVGGGCCDASNPTTSCCDGSLCVAGAPSGVSCESHAGHCENCPIIANACTSNVDCCGTVPCGTGGQCCDAAYTIDGCTSDADCCPTGIPKNRLHCLPSGSGQPPSGPNCCRPAQYGDPCNVATVATDCPGNVGDQCLDHMCVNPGLKQAGCATGFCPSQLCYTPSPTGHGSGGAGG